MRQTDFLHQIVDFIPEQLKEGVIYVSYRYRTAVHKCACGCGEEVVTPIGPADWSIQIENDTATLYPSIGNWSFACQSHYFIRKGRVIWAGWMSRQQIEHGRQLDQESREQYFNDVNHDKSLPRHSVIRKVWMVLRRWWMS